MFIVALAEHRSKMDPGLRRDDEMGKREFLLCIGLYAASATPIAAASGLPWEIWESPSHLATIDPADIVLERSSHCLDGCRYDRSNRGPEDPAANPYPLRWL